MLVCWLSGSQAGSSHAGTPNFDLVGFAALPGFATNGTWQPLGTTGGAGGAHRQVWTVPELVGSLTTNVPLLVEVMTNLDLSSLSNHSGGFPAGYPVGEILVRSNKTLYSKHGATLSRGSLRLGKPSLGPQGNVIIRNLRFRDLWVPDPTGKYDTYGWDYIHLEEASHHVWVDHCDFERAYDGMVDLVHASDLVTVSWNVLRAQKKCSLVGHSDNNQAEDAGHLNVTFHHNHFIDVEERMPRMRFGNAHVFNDYSQNLGGKGVQSTCDAATLVEHVFVQSPQAGSYPTIEANGGPTGTVKVVSGIISNLPGVSVVFREYGAASFTFKAPFAGPTPPYAYAADPTAEVPARVARYAGLGKIGFELWRMEEFPRHADATNAAVSGPGAAPAGDGVPNVAKYALGLRPRQPAALPLVTVGAEPGALRLSYRRPATASDVLYRVETSTNLTDWSTETVLHERMGTAADGMETWVGRVESVRDPQRFLRLVIER